MGLHVTESSVVARGNIITGTRLDHERDMGDAVYAVESELRLEKNIMRGNAGSGVATAALEVTLSGNDLIDNGRSGMLLLDRSRAEAKATHRPQRAAGVEVAEQSKATLSGNASLPARVRHRRRLRAWRARRGRPRLGQHLQRTDAPARLRRVDAPAAMFLQLLVAR